MIDVPDSSAWYGYYGTVTLRVTNLGTGKVYTYKGRWR
jgi:hypothetical protein